jgi:tetratricopeptide (TPR) repeat protein
VKRILVILSFICLTLLGLWVVNQVPSLAKENDMSAAANQLYETGQYALAAQAYQQLVDQGYADSALFYNLGNANYKQGDLGRAILNYRRAERLAPRDEDIQANLELARGQIANPVEQMDGQKSLLIQVAGFTRNWLTLNELALLALGLWILLALLMMAFSSSRQGSKLWEGLQYGVVVAALALLLAVIGLGSRLYVDYTRPEGVIVAGEVNVTTSPDGQGETVFVLPSGSEVEIIEQRGSWIHLVLPDQSDKQGWAPALAVEKL